MSNHNPAGSTWRKWDLHVHTPASIVQNHGGNTDEIWERFIADLEKLPLDFKVIGINGHRVLRCTPARFESFVIDHAGR
ncbi:hypothetical protein [Metallibacterium sp.]|uniref:hypothetical protein n=1 Tax=Metallibacterium sp. TaxID=2940281 RepID=UPI0026096897|nr:hypothetical protein [Metallibacterium sp.]